MLELSKQENKSNKKFYLGMLVGLTIILSLVFILGFKQSSSDTKDLSSEKEEGIIQRAGEGIITYGSDWENYDYGGGQNRLISGVSNILTYAGYVPFNQAFNISREGRFIKLKAEDYNITLDWGIIQTNGEMRDSQWVLDNYPNVVHKLKPRKFRSFIEWDFEVNTSTIPEVVKRNVEGFYFHLEGAEGNITWNDVSKNNNTIYIKNTRLSFDKEVNKGVNLTINKSDIVYHNITALVVDGMFTSDPVIKHKDYDNLQGLNIKYTGYEMGMDVQIGTPEGKGFDDTFSLYKWDREVNTQFLFPENESEITWNDTRVRKTYEDYSVEWYVSSNNSFKFDVIIPNPLPDNTFSVPINSTDLVFAYQGRLDDERQNYSCNATDCEGAHRPINIVGSYAVYHISKRNNQYQSGKAYHIYRPLIIDVNGNETWGMINITDGILNITINESAVYPIIIDPDVGYTTQGGTSDNINADRAHAHADDDNTRVATNGAGLGERVTNMSAWLSVDTIENSETIGMAVYNTVSHLTKEPWISDVRLTNAETVTVDSTSAAIRTSQNIQVTMTSGVRYKVAWGDFSTISGEINSYYDANAAGRRDRQGGSDNLLLNWVHTSNRTAAEFSYWFTWENVTDDVPVVNLSAPPDDTANATTTFTFECNVTDDVNITNTTLYIWNSTFDIWNDTETNFSTSTTSLNYSFQIDNFAVDDYVWNCLATDDNNGRAWATSNWSLNVTADVAGEATDILFLNSTEVLEDLQFDAGVFSDVGFQIKWDLTDFHNIVTNCSKINDATIVVYQDNSPGSLDNDTRMWYLQNQSWTEGDAAASIEGHGIFNQTDKNWNNIAQNAYSNVSVLEFVQEACYRTDYNMTVRFEDVDNLVGTISVTTDDTHLDVGSIGIGGDQLHFRSREHATPENRPKLYINYTLEFSSTLNTTISTENEANVFMDEFYAEWYVPSGFTIDSCTFELNQVNYTANVSGILCFWNSTQQDTNWNILIPGNHTWRGWANETGGAKDSTLDYTINLSQNDISGYWLARAPWNSTNDKTGESGDARRYGDVTGTGYDIGVLWRNSTTDVDGDYLQDEALYCSGWGEFMLDEPGYHNGTINHFYCHAWIYAANITDHGETDSENHIGLGINHDRDTFNYSQNLSELQSYPKNATYFHLSVINKTNLDWTYSDAREFFNASLKGEGGSIQLMSWQNQRTFCIFNNLNGVEINDTTALNASDFDGDGVSDYTEMYLTYTDPTDADTDDDGHSDLQEYQNNKDGWDPYDWGTIHIYKGNESSLTINWTNSSAVYPPLFDYSDTLAYEPNQGEYNNLTIRSPLRKFFILRTIKATEPGEWLFAQYNYNYSITQNVSNIINMNIFHAASVGDTGVPETENKTYEIKNRSGGVDLFIRGEHSANVNLYSRQIRSSFSDFVDENGTIEMRYYLYANISAGGQDVSREIGLDFGEVWVVTGVTEVNITYPLNYSKINISTSEIFSVNFTFTEDGEDLIGGVSIENITINGTICSLSGGAVYQEPNWIQNCTTPNLLVSGIYNLSIVANTSSSGFLTDLEPYSINYTHTSSCGCPGMDKNWEVDLSDNCELDTDCHLGTGTLNFTGIGWANCSAKINTTNMGDPFGGFLYIASGCNLRIF